MTMNEMMMARLAMTRVLKPEPLQEQRQRKQALELMRGINQRPIGTDLSRDERLAAAWRGRDPSVNAEEYPLLVGIPQLSGDCR